MTQTLRLTNETSCNVCVARSADSNSRHCCQTSPKIGKKFSDESLRSRRIDNVRDNDRSSGREIKKRARIGLWLPAVMEEICRTPEFYSTSDAKTFVTIPNTAAAARREDGAKLSGTGETEKLWCGDD